MAVSVFKMHEGIVLFHAFFCLLQYIVFNFFQVHEPPVFKECIEDCKNQNDDLNIPGVQSVVFHLF